jgi:hypothetical protein
MTEMVGQTGPSAVAHGPELSGQSGSAEPRPSGLLEATRPGAVVVGRVEENRSRW